MAEPLYRPATPTLPDESRDVRPYRILCQYCDGNGFVLGAACKDSDGYGHFKQD